MGIIVGLLVSTQGYFAHEPGMLHHLYVTHGDTIRHWVEITAYTAIALGPALGGWRIVHTMGSRITLLRPVGGFCAANSHAGIFRHHVDSVAGPRFEPLAGPGTSLSFDAVRDAIFTEAADDDVAMDHDNRNNLNNVTVPCQFHFFTQ